MNSSSALQSSTDEALLTILFFKVFNNFRYLLHVHFVLESLTLWALLMQCILMYLDGVIMQSMLQRWFQERRSHFWDENSMRQATKDSGNSFGRLPYQLWSVSKYGSCADAAITGIMPPPLVELQVLYSDACSFTSVFFPLLLFLF